MAEEEASPSSTPKSSVWSKKFHGVPVPLLVVGGGVLAFVGWKWWKGRQSSSTTTAPSATTTGATTGTADNSGDGLGGGYGGGYGGSDNTPGGSITGVTKNPDGSETVAYGNGQQFTIPAGNTTAPTVADKTAQTGLTALGAQAVANGRTVVTNPNGGNDDAAINSLAQANANRQKAIASGNATAIAAATKQVKSASAVVADRNKAATAAKK